MPDLPNPEEYDFEKLAKEIVSTRLKEEKGADEAVGEVVRKIVTAAVLGTKARQDPRLTILAAVKGAMNGVLLAEGNLATAGTAVLQQMANIASETSLDPQETMTWAMESLAAAAVMSTPEAQSAMHNAIEEKFMGAGSVFNELVQKALPKPGP